MDQFTFYDLYYETFNRLKDEEIVDLLKEYVTMLYMI